MTEAEGAGPTKTLPTIILDVRDFGAVGDGSTDDTGALRKAIAAAKGCVFHLPQGLRLVGMGHDCLLDGCGT